jgi:hypothetical protein
MSKRSGSGERAWVPVGCGEQGDDAFACADGRAAELGVLHRDPGGDEVGDAEVAQQLLDRVAAGNREPQRCALLRGGAQRSSALASTSRADLEAGR